MWAVKLGVADMAERLVAHRIAVSILKLERCEAADRAVVGPNVEAALRDWERERRHAVRRRAQELADDPAGTVRTLRGSAFGCDWLIRKWRQLRTQVADGRGWTGTGLALLLMGRRPGSAPADDPNVAALLAGADALTAGADATAPAVVALVALIEQIIGNLEQHRAAAWEAVEGPEREAVIANARVDSSPEGRLRHRYEQDAERSMSRNLDLLLKLRKVEAERPARPAPSPRPVADPRPRAQASGAPPEAPPSRNEPRSATRTPEDSGPIPMPGKTLSETVPADPINIPRRTEAAPDRARSAPPAHRGRFPAHRAAAGRPSRRPGATGPAASTPDPPSPAGPQDGPRSFSIGTSATVPDRAVAVRTHPAGAGSSIGQPGLPRRCRTGRSRPHTSRRSGVVDRSAGGDRLQLLPALEGGGELVLDGLEARLRLGDRRAVAACRRRGRPSTSVRAWRRASSSSIRAGKAASSRCSLELSRRGRSFAGGDGAGFAAGFGSGAGSSFRWRR